MSNNKIPELHFQDFAPQATKQSSVQKNADGSKTYNFSDFPSSAMDEDDAGPTGNDAALKPKSSFWSFEYYQQYFDVDSDQVFSRMINSMIPRFGVNFIAQHVRPNPDLYGPFWICVTLVFALAAAGNFASYFSSSDKSEDFHWSVNFRMVTISATVIFFYAWLVPLLIWAFLWWKKMEINYSYLEMLCAYGYSLSIFIPISILWTIPINWVQWSLVGIGAFFSGFVLLFTFWPVVKENNSAFGLIVVVIIVTLHSLLAVSFKYSLFAHDDSNASQNVAFSSKPVMDLNHSSTIANNNTV